MKTSVRVEDREGIVGDRVPSRSIFVERGSKKEKKEKGKEGKREKEKEENASRHLASRGKRQNEDSALRFYASSRI